MDYTNAETISKLGELLDMLKTMSSGYDPTVSTESDPIVVLLKEMAMSDDQIIYLIEKAIGEIMPSRVQHRENALELYNSLGYNAKKYRSANGYINIRLKNVLNLAGNDGTGVITIPKFTRLGDANSGFEYVTLEKMTWTLSTATIARAVNIMEGRLKDLQVAGTSEIRLVNLDENYRIYFPEKNIAENGVFITFETGEEFVRADNVYALNNANIYYVGEDENEQVYVQFPQTIVDTMGGGGYLSVKYLLSSGVNGNCKIGTLTNVLDDIIDPSTNESISAKVILSQAEPMNNGSNPECLDYMYKNFKKTQNKLETLVVEKDYEGAAYLAEHNRMPLWSNVVVASRLNDLNQTIQIKELIDFRTRDVYRLLDQDDTHDGGIKPTTIYVYGLTQTNGFDGVFVSDITSGALAKFEEQIYSVRAINQDIRSPQAETGNSLQLGFLNTFILSGTILLKNNITKNDEVEIKNKIMQRLSYTYSARQREFGQEIDYNEAVNTIVESDGRIQTIALNIPKYQIRNISSSNSSALNGYLTDDRKAQLIAKMILRGNIQLFQHDTTFTLDFGQVASDIITDIVGISTMAGNVQDDKNLVLDGYKLQANESVHVKGNKYRTSIEYGALVNFRFEANSDVIVTQNTTLTQSAILASGSIVRVGSKLILNITTNTVTEALPQVISLAPNSILNAGTIIANGSTGLDAGTLSEALTLKTATTIAIGSQIATGSILILASDYTFYYGSGISTGSVLSVDSIIMAGSNYEGQVITRVLKENTDNLLIAGDMIYVKYNDGGIIKTAVYQSGDIIRPSFDLTQTLIAGEYPMTLATGQSISIRELATSVISKGTLVYFIGNNQTLSIPAYGQYEMGEKEYLIYTSQEKDELIIINPGTILTNNTRASITHVFGSEIDLNNLSESDRENIEWQELAQDITVIDQEIYTFGESVTVISNTPLTKNMSELIHPLTATDESGNSITLQYEITGQTCLRARIVLDIVATNKQTLKAGQTVILTNSDGDNTLCLGTSDGITLFFDQPVIALGSEGNRLDPVNVISYLDLNIGGDALESNPTITDGVLYITKQVMDAQPTQNLLTLPFSFNTFTLINISINTLKYDTNANPTFTVKSGNASLSIIGGGTLGDADHPLSNVQADYQCFVSKGNSNIVITASDLLTQNFMRIGRMVSLKQDAVGNPIMNIDEITLSAGGDYNDTQEDAYDLYDKTIVDNVEQGQKRQQDIMNYVVKYGQGAFDYGYTVPENKKITQPTRSINYFKPQHIGSKYTIAKLDLEKTASALIINPSQVI
jgi:hypothetical protein